MSTHPPLFKMPARKGGKSKNKKSNKPPEDDSNNASQVENNPPILESALQPHQAQIRANNRTVTFAVNGSDSESSTPTRPRNTDMQASTTPRHEVDENTAVALDPPMDVIGIDEQEDVSPHLLAGLNVPEKDQYKWTQYLTRLIFVRQSETVAKQTRAQKQLRLTCLLLGHLEHLHVVGHAEKPSPSGDVELSIQRELDRLSVSSTPATMVTPDHPRSTTRLHPSDVASRITMNKRVDSYHYTADPETRDPAGLGPD
ncbi:hypothetical protein K435DRAFT_875786 [Dendrothele bispora CBS 962.96]|uniref:Uncharacterized protein n=1 Tax=Dendrothele bispora (strain CBS 962.96) TaxID=1314807 RepID=A0A4S8KTK6_DENBC|nr:hypothetical protein K435DRAFT_875786 [Dendrothele bispora CBS 962.96]